jgi:pimeloyl-ACP methyl ester carboxylesterase
VAASRYQGERVDIGGRHLRVARAGTVSGGPLIVCEHGAYGSATDWAVVQALLAAGGRRSLAYDRAGLGYSDPGPEPRDGRAINDDLETLLEALGETAPILLVGHSMGGLMVRLFALERTRALVGLVLVDAVTPDVLGLPGVAPGVQVFGRLLQVVSQGAKAGLMHPVSWVAGNPIELPGEAGAEKRRIHASASHAQGAAAEVVCWPETSRMAGAADLPLDLPVAVVTAGPSRGGGALKRMQEAPAKRARAGHVEHVTAANHANLLGPRFAAAIVRGVDHALGKDA